MLFDSHIHLDFYSTNSRKLETDWGREGIGERTQVIQTAVSAGVSSFFVPGCRIEQWEALRELFVLDVPGAQIYCGVGQHPYWASDVRDLNQFAASLVNSLKQLGAVAIGECGLDKKRGGEMKHQIALFELHLKIARELTLPCVVHCVGAQAELFGCLERVGVGAAGAVLHGFSGDRSFAQSLIRRGFLLGVGPAVTKTSRQRLREACAAIPEDSYVLETDAPDTRADPLASRGAAADLVQVAQELAQLRKQPFELVSQQSTVNARRLFGLK